MESTRLESGLEGFSWDEEFFGSGFWIACCPRFLFASLNLSSFGLWLLSCLIKWTLGLEAEDAVAGDCFRLGIVAPRAG